MKEYKFRGKRTDNGEWVYGSFITLKVGEKMASFIIVDNNAVVDHKLPPMAILFTLNKDIFMVKPETVGQFTDLHDKNGKEIYKDDIVEFVNVDLPDCVIVYDNGSFMYRELGEDISLEELRLQFTVEVIGNIHDNPNLLQ